MRTPKFLFGAVAFIIIVSGLLVALQNQPIPPQNSIRYGVTFSEYRTNELRLDWKETYDAILDDLGVRRFRFVAHWELTEPEEGKYDFSVLDYQMKRAEETGSEVILAIGRRLPSWPECHVPQWAQGLSDKERDAKLLEYMQAVIDRYKDSPALKWWQVENEPYIIGFAYQNCGSVDTRFLEDEVAFVHEHDPGHPVLLTASGELGLWDKTWSKADAFGTTLYRYVYNADLKRFITYPTTPAFFRAKRTLTQITVKNPHIPSIIAELEAEPWPIGPIVDTPLPEQLARMDIGKFNDIIHFAARTGFEEQYFWGAEWWYYVKKEYGDDTFWNRAKELFKS